MWDHVPLRHAGHESAHNRRTPRRPGSAKRPTPPTAPPQPQFGCGNLSLFVKGTGENRAYNFAIGGSIRELCRTDQRHRLQELQSQPAFHNTEQFLHLQDANSKNCGRRPKIDCRQDLGVLVVTPWETDADTTAPPLPRPRVRRRPIPSGSLEPESIRPAGLLDPRLAPARTTRRRYSCVRSRGRPADRYRTEA